MLLTWRKNAAVTLKLYRTCLIDGIINRAAHASSLSNRLNAGRNRLDHIDVRRPQTAGAGDTAATECLSKAYHDKKTK